MPAQIYARATGILDSPVGPDFVALNIQRGKCFGMENVSAEVWRLLANPRSLDQLCGELSAIYDVDDETCRADVSELLVEMIDMGLIEPRSPD